MDIFLTDLRIMPGQNERKPETMAHRKDETGLRCLRYEVRPSGKIAQYSRRTRHEGETGPDAMPALPDKPRRDATWLVNETHTRLLKTARRANPWSRPNTEFIKKASGPVFSQDT